MTTTTRRRVIASPQRWQEAAARAHGEQIRVMCVASTGQWVASSGSRPDLAYALEVTGEIAHGCECQAARHGDPVCKHRAAFYMQLGTLDPPRATPAPEAACFWCHGSGTVANDYLQQFQDCEPCDGTGIRKTQSD